MREDARIAHGRKVWMGRRRGPRAAALTAFVLLAAACTSNGSSSPGTNETSAAGPVHIEFWHGQAGVAQRSLDSLIEEFNRTHPDIVVESTSGGATVDNMLPKVTTAIAAGTYPDIAYLFGSWSANIATAEKVVDLTSYVEDPSFGWEDYWPPLREAATVDGRVIGVPAAAGNLTVVYNRALFDEAGLAEPSPDWTWDDFRTAARTLTDDATNTYGTSWPITGDEDTVWRFWPLLWQEGGEIISDDHTEVAFDSEAGIRALTFVQQMAQDGSIYKDSTDEKGTQLFLSGHLGMLVTGPWVLADIKAARIDYGVQMMPAFSGTHTTIAGADNWVVFDRGQARIDASVEFLRWLTAPEQDMTYALAVGNMPIRAGSTEQPDYDKYVKEFPGVETMVANLADARSRPALKQYPRLSAFVGQAIVKVILGESDPAAALHEAADQANALLAIPA
jgi:multiple sugar transport system substrate-binding protein